ncbi:hypothetical protein ONZ45_g12185 [Pleurotus djamor]|nr:hypothetical protein ONZ45_g12185 [Pleurotus djamor]
MPLISPNPAQGLIDKEILALKEAIRSLKTARNTHSYISQIPDELLSAIFIQGKISASKSHTGTRSWLNIASVCRHWRQVSVDTPQLWSSIHIRNATIDRAEEMLKRSKASPLDLKISLKLSDDPRVFKLAKLSLSDIGTLRELRVTSDDFTLYRELLNCSVDRSAPILRRLRLLHQTPTPSASVQSDEFMFSDMPVLTCLELRHFPIPASIPLFNNLTRLRINNSRGSGLITIQLALRILKQTPQAEEVLLVKLKHHHQQDEAEFYPVGLPRLKSLKVYMEAIDASIIFDYLDIPKSTFISTDCSEVTSESDPVDISYIHQAWSRFSARDTPLTEGRIMPTRIQHFRIHLFAETSEDPVLSLCHHIPVEPFIPLFEIHLFQVTTLTLDSLGEYRGWIDLLPSFDKVEYLTLVNCHMDFVDVLGTRQHLPADASDPASVDSDKEDENTETSRFNLPMLNTLVLEDFTFHEKDYGENHSDDYRKLHRVLKKRKLTRRFSKSPVSDNPAVAVPAVPAVPAVLAVSPAAPAVSFTGLSKKKLLKKIPAPAIVPTPAPVDFSHVAVQTDPHTPPKIAHISPVSYNPAFPSPRPFDAELTMPLAIAKVVQKDQTKCPSFEPGRLTIENIWDFHRACLAYFETNDIAAEDQVRKIWYALKEPSIHTWMAGNDALFKTFSFDAFLGQLRDVWLGENWLNDASHALLNYRQSEDQEFMDFAVTFLRKRAYLEGTPSALDDERARFTLQGNMLQDLHREASSHPSRLAAASQPRRTNTSGARYPNNNTSSSSARPDSRSRPPAITESERRLLKDNNGCYKCRKFFVGFKGSHPCDFPDGANYVELTQADVDRARASTNRSGNSSRTSTRPPSRSQSSQGTARRTVAAVVDEANTNNDADDDVNFLAAAVMDSAVIEDDDAWSDIIFKTMSKLCSEMRDSVSAVKAAVNGQEMRTRFKAFESVRGKAKVASKSSPAVVAAALQQRISSLALQERLRKLDAAMKKKHSDMKTINCREYSCPKKYKESWRILLDQHLAAGRIRPSSSAFASAAFLLQPQSAGTSPFGHQPTLLPDPTALPRWVNDYRQLNGITVPDRFPLPLIPDILGDCAKGKIWGKIDMTNAFFQTKVHPDDIPLTAVRTPFGLFEWTVMPQGLCNAPSTHQRRMNAALQPFTGKFCHAYLDDIIIWSSSVEEHTKNVETVLQALREAALFCSIKKTDLFCTEIDFLGHHISARGIEANAAKAEKIMSWPTPATVGDVRRFLGLVRYLASFLPRLATLTAVLTPLTGGKASTKDPVSWSEKHDTAFNGIKSLIASRECLTTIDHENPGDNTIFVTTDASNLGTGGVLSFGPTWETARPVAYDSRQFSQAERSYPTHEQEMLAIIRALKKWRTDLLGAHFIVYTDHRTLEFFQRQPNLSKRQLRWQEFLADYDFEIRYIRGEDNTVADALSRTFVDDTPLCAAALQVHPDEELTRRIIAGYAKDPWCAKLASASSGMQGVSCRNGLFFIKDRLVIPRDPLVREWIFQLAHDALGHFGTAKSYSASFYWPNMRTDLETAYIPGCLDCQRNKSSTHKASGPLHPLPVPDDRFTSVAIDFVGPLPEDDGYDYLCTMTGRLGEDIRLVPCKSTITAEEFGVVFFDSWFCNNGLPADIVSDRDKIFISRFWKSFASLAGVKLRMSTAFHPQTDGASERTNKSVVQALRFMVGDRQEGWVKALPRIRFALMNTVNVSTGFSGFQLSHGFSPRLIPPFVRQEGDTDSLRSAADVLSRLSDDVNQAKDTLLASKVAQCHYANRSRGQEPSVKVGDKVLLSSSNRRKELAHGDGTTSAKLLPRFTGPYRVLRSRPDSSSYTIDNDADKFPSRELSRPAPSLNPDTGYDECVVDRIVAERRRGRGVQYKVRFVGYGPEDDEWLSRAECEDLEALDKWLAAKGSR